MIVMFLLVNLWYASVLLCFANMVMCHEKLLHCKGTLIQFATKQFVCDNEGGMKCRGRKER